MKKSVRMMGIVLITAMLLSLQVSQLSAESLASKKDPKAPVAAHHVTLVKKVTLKVPPVKPEKAPAGIATGEIGEALPAGGQRYALVIGISDYPGTANDLNYADDDARSIAEDVLPLYGFEAANIEVLIDDAARRGTIYDKIDELRQQLTENDELVFYFSGHGSSGYADDGDTIALDQSIVVCDDTYTSYTHIWDGELKSWFAGFKTSRILFVFDSCLAGGMSVLQKEGRIVAMGSTIKTYSYEGDWGGGHGQFTYYFAIEGLQYEYADTFQKDGDVTVEEAYDYAKANCRRQKTTVVDLFSKDMLLN